MRSLGVLYATAVVITIFTSSTKAAVTVSRGTAGGNATAAPGLVAPSITVDSATAAATQAISPTALAWATDAEFRAESLKAHNSYRSQHDVSDLSWNSTLEEFAMDYLESRGSGSNKCPPFEHTGGPYGENFALGFDSAAAAVKAWGDERESYDFSDPGYSDEAGHFTQVVWKGSATVGCGRKYCSGDQLGIVGWYFVCEYYPRGNVLGEFEGNVFRGTYG